MRQRLLMGMVGAIIVLAAALSSLAVAGRAGPAPHGTGTPVQVHPAAPSGVCLPATQQCAPVTPQGGAAAAPTAVVVVGLLVAVALLTLTRARVRRRPHAGSLAPGFVTPLLHPPQADLGTV